MRMRGFAAAAAGVAGAAGAHLLDVAGLLPGVHETVAVRTAMGPLLTVAWLLVAGGLAWLACVTRPVPVGAVAAVVVSGAPELIGRHDPGAVAEPGAIAGALLQWLLLLLVVAVAVLLERQLATRPFAPAATPPRPAGACPAISTALVPSAVSTTARPRAPPWWCPPQTACT
jgi:hypothetical protein